MEIPRRLASNMKLVLYFMGTFGVAIRCAQAILPFPLRVRRGRAKMTSGLIETHFSTVGLMDHCLENWTLTSSTVVIALKALGSV